MVTTITYRNPAILAREAQTVDHISNGRLELAIGAGGAPADSTMTGVDLWEPTERVSRFGEFVEIVDGLLRGEEVTFRGSFYQTEAARIHPAPIQQPRPPISLAAEGPRAPAGR
jgi:alkanesulfonate monooxygenase SsuD/methylene tetrahydromethanopterin reductase-like flavin-dependent oxidoreductase (luciferase family)